MTNVQMDNWRMCELLNVRNNFNNYEVFYRKS